MISSKNILIGNIVVCFSLLGVALYLQLVENMLPCPLCVAQRYAFISVALCCSLALALPDTARRTLIALGVASAGYGASVAMEQLHVLANPSSSCGIDLLEVALNKLPFAEWLPVLFQANGICSTPYAPILGLSIPAWALVWFIVAMAALCYAFVQQTPRGMFGKRR